MTKERIRQAIDQAKSKGRRERMLGVRMTEAEYERLRKAARKEGIPAAELARIFISAALDDVGGK